MPVLPRTVTPNPQYAMYLAPTGAAGDEALTYLPAYNAWVREYYIRKGFVLLNEVSGDFVNTDGNGLRIEPPSDETIQAVVEELQARVDDERAKLEEALASAREKREYAVGDTRQVYNDKVAALERRVRLIGEEQPSFLMLKAFFLRLHQGTLAASIKPEMRSEMARLMQEQAIGRAVESVSRELAQEMRTESQTKGAPDEPKPEPEPEPEPEEQTGSEGDMAAGSAEEPGAEG